ncbi:F-box protein [Cocos nucifera]|uniref:F-box protein n=1 Tax=Cocos nucifera TaxID=13894 RepID=A0A8K0IMM8_COCNU|nr:F-box protein [Cocos nucifera]
MDTLAGVAIKYGVEVADIRRMNGLVTDLQMFAHKSLQIPLPGKHSPSPIPSNGSTYNGEQTPPHQPHIDILESFQSLKSKPPPCKISPAMSSLQGYYGLTRPKSAPRPKGTEVAACKTGRSLCLENKQLPGESPISDPLDSWNRRSRSVANGFSLEDGEVVEDNIVAAEAVDNSEAERSIRRRQKSDALPSQQMPELLLEDGSGGFAGRTAKGLALRPKSGSRTDMDMGRRNGVSFGDSMAGGFSTVHKSSSTSNLQDADESSSIWSTSKWTLKPEVLARPLFDGLPKPTAARRNKAARD